MEPYVVHWLDAMERDYHKNHSPTKTKKDYIYFVNPSIPSSNEKRISDGRPSILNLMIDQRKKAPLLRPALRGSNYQGDATAQPDGTMFDDREEQSGRPRMLAEIEAEDLRELLNTLLGYPRKLLDDLLSNTEPTTDLGLGHNGHAASISRPQGHPNPQSVVPPAEDSDSHHHHHHHHHNHQSIDGVDLHKLAEISPHHYEHCVCQCYSLPSSTSWSDLRSSTPRSVDELPHVLHVYEPSEDQIPGESDYDRIVAEIALIPGDPPCRGLVEVFKEPDLAQYLLRQCRKHSCSEGHIIYNHYNESSSQLGRQSQVKNGR